MDNFYKISKYAGCFKIQRKYDYFPSLELSCKKYSKIFQHKHAIIAELATGGYDFFLPSAKYDFSSHKYEVVNRPLTLIISNISEYLPYQDIFAFKKDCVWKFLLLHNFEMNLELEDDIICSLDKRLSELPSITCGEDTSASFKIEFETLYNSQYSDNKHHLAIFHADQDYLIDAQEHDIPLYDSGIKTSCLGTATILPGGNGRFFKATYNKGEAWYHNQYSDGYLYSSIKPMKENEYPSIYPIKDFSGYWKKNNDGIIVGLAFLSNTDSTSFQLLLPCPAKEVQFVKEINQMNLYDGTSRMQSAFLWKIVSKTDQILFLLVLGKIYVTMTLQDFTD